MVLNFDKLYILPLSSTFKLKPSGVKILRPPTEIKTIVQQPDLVALIKPNKKIELKNTELKSRLHLHVQIVLGMLMRLTFDLIN